jgi:CHASE3 domain sensor protein
VNRNLITRMGTASGVVAALVAAVFAVLVTAVRDQRESTAAVRSSQQVITAATEAREDVIRLELAQRGNLAGEPDVQAARGELMTILRDRLPVLVAGNETQQARVAGLDPDDPGAEAALSEIIATEQAVAEKRRKDADSKA